MKNMACSNRIFVLYEKHDPRYVRAQYKEQTARLIVQDRIDQGGWYDQKTLDKIQKLWKSDHSQELIFKFLQSRNDCEYEGFEVVYPEDLTDRSKDGTVQ